MQGSRELWDWGTDRGPEREGAMPKEDMKALQPISYVLLYKPLPFGCSLVGPS